MSKSETVISRGHGTYTIESFNPGSGVLISALSENAAASPAQDPLQDKEETGVTDIWQNWGTDNLHPRNVRLLIEKSTVAAPLLYKSVCQMYGMGVRYWLEEYEGEKVVKKFDRIKDVDLFFTQNYIDYIVLERLMDFKYFNNIFQEYIFDLGMSKVVNTFHLETEFCRLSTQNEQTGRKEYVGYWGDWANPADGIVKIPLFDFLKESPDEARERFVSSKKFAVHSKFPSPGRPFYGVPPHHALFRKDGWLQYSNAIPEILNAIIDNSMNIKYHIKIPADYWAAVYLDWADLDDAKREEKKTEKLQEMNDWLTGTKNSMKSFISEFITDPITGKKLPGWEIESMDDKTKMDKHNLTSQESDAHIARALNVDPSIAGLQPQGGKMGAGSGSDKRVSLTNALSMQHAEELVIFDFLYLIAKFNGWPENIRFGFGHEIPETLDKEPSGVKEM